MKKPIENLEQLKQFTAKEKFYVVTDDEVNNMRKFHYIVFSRSTYCAIIDNVL